MPNVCLNHKVKQHLKFVMWSPDSNRLWFSARNPCRAGKVAATLAKVLMSMLALNYPASKFHVKGKTVNRRTECVDGKNIGKLIMTLWCQKMRCSGRFSVIYDLVKVTASLVLDVPLVPIFNGNKVEGLIQYFTQPLCSHTALKFIGMGSGPDGWARAAKSW